MNKKIRDVGEEGIILEDNILYKNIKLIKKWGQSFILSKKAILTVNITDICCAHCSFCSNLSNPLPCGFLHMGKKVKKVLKLCRLGGISKVSFTGGEPTIYPQAFYDLYMSFPKIFEKVRLHTNGYKLFEKIIDKNKKSVSLLDSLVKNGLNGVSLSVAHYCSDKCTKIMNGGPFITEQNIKKLSRYKKSGLLVRLSCILLPQYIYSVEEILKYIKWGKSLGVENFVFRVPFGIPNKYKIDVPRFLRKNIPDIDLITKKLFSMGAKEIYGLHKSDVHEHKLHFDKVFITLDNASEEVDKDKKIRRLIIMPNGDIYTNWLYKSPLF